MKKYSQVGERLKQLRGKLSQEGFAKEIGVSFKSYQRYEYGQYVPHPHKLTKIAEMCDTTVDWILTGDLNIEKARRIEWLKRAYTMEELAEKLQESIRREEELLVKGVKEEAANSGSDRLGHIGDKDLLETLRSIITDTKIDLLGAEDRRMVDDLLEILKSENTDIIDAIKANIKEFRGAAKAIKERRRYYRFSITIPIAVKILDEPGSPGGIIIDASQMGLCVQSFHEMEIGKKIDLEIASKDNDGTPCRTKGQIMWREGKRLDDSEAFQYGVKLVGLSDEDHAKLESLLGGCE